MKFTVFTPRIIALSLGVVLLGFGQSTGTTSVAMTPKAPAAPKVLHVSAANDALDFDLVNATGYDLKEIYISPSSSTDWNDDILNGATFADGAKLHITFSPKATAAHWDMRVTYVVDGTYKEFDNLNLTSISKVTLHWDGNHTSADVE
jgi:hypothetical protein